MGIYHHFNIFWFKLAGVLAILGAVYAKIARGKQAFAREADAEEEVKGETAEEA